MNYVDDSYYSSPTYTPNPFTGNTPSGDVNFYENKSLVLTIQNQAFESSNSFISLHYSVQWKGHFETTWNLFNVDINPDTISDINVFPIGFSGDNGTFGSPATVPDVPNGGKIDFQVEAATGSWYTVPYYPHGYDSNGNPIGMPFGTTPVFNGTTSGWSNIATISIPDGSVTSYPNTGTPPISTQETPIPNPTPTPTVSPSTTSATSESSPAVPEFPTWIILALFAAVLLSTVFARKRITKTSSFKQKHWLSLFCITHNSLQSRF